MLDKIFLNSIITPILAVVAAILIGATPIVSVITASAVANANNCTLHEGFVNPCVVGGVDVGHTLYSMFVLGWLAFISIPLGALGLLMSVVWLLVVILVKRGRKRA